MIIQSAWLIRLVLAHLLTDFLFQPASWIQHRHKKHFASYKLYVHGLVTGATAFLLTGLSYPVTAAAIALTHILIDGWKSYRPAKVKYFLLDQALHFMVIILCWYSTFLHWRNVQFAWKFLNANTGIWKMAAAFVFLSLPAGSLIGQLTKQWREKIDDAASLENAGKWIGIMERFIILVFVLYNQYAAIGLLVAAKGIIRFNEKDRPEIKTEYLVIGTLLSISTALLTGLILKLL